MTNTEQFTARYYAYFNYLVAVKRLISRLYPTDENLVQNIVSSKGYQRLKGNPSADKKRIAELLHNSWFTQIQLVEIGKYSDLVPLNSPWSLVQAYYAIYSASRAYLLAQGREVHNNHATTLSTLANDISVTNSRFPLPWNCSYRENPNSKVYTLHNAPVGIKVNLTNPLCSPYTTEPWQHFGLFLKTTRKKQLASSIDRWKEEHKRKRILSVEREFLLNTLRPTTFFDALYRVRTRSNYQDIDSFVFGVSTLGFSSDDANNFHEAIIFITEATLLVFETLIAKALKKKWLLSEMESFTSSVFVLPRREILLKYHSILTANI